MKALPWLRAASLLAAISLATPLLHAQELVVSAAASLTNAFQVIGPVFEKTYPGRKVIFNFAASGALLAQIQQGAPVDVFASADQQTMDRAAGANLLAPSTRADFVRNELVLIVPAKVAQTPKALGDLAGAGYKRIAAGTPASVPVGRYTMGVIDKTNLADALKPKWIYGESVRQVLDYVARGEVDAGFVYRTDAMIAAKDTRVAFSVPTQTPVTYPIAQIAASRNGEAARDFIAFVRGPQGQKVLDGFGFSRP